MKDRDLEAQDINSTYEKWSAESFMLDEIERTPDVNDRLVMMYDYFRVFGHFPDTELEDNE